MTGLIGTFVVPWSQTEIDGLTGAPVSALEPGMTWRWSGRAVRVDGPDDILVLHGPEDDLDLRRRAARTVRRMMGVSRMAPRLMDIHQDEPLFERSFQVSDGRRSFSITLIDMADSARPLLLFMGEMAPADRDLWITHGPTESGRINRTADQPTGVICFAQGTMLRTPQGLRTVEDLCPGDMVDTRDSGAQPVQWIGHRRISGARMHALPDLRPVRVRAGALGQKIPAPDLLVSPGHRILVRGEMARALFDEREVLVSAADMINDRSITIEYGLHDIVYYHILLPAHHVVWANGVATESFHPAHTALDTLTAEQRAALLESAPTLASDPHSFGAPARRMLTRSEAAILLHRISRHSAPASASPERRGLTLRRQGV